MRAAPIISCVLSALLLVAVPEAPAQACSYVQLSQAEKVAQNRRLLRESKSVKTGATCAFVNGGIGDNWSGGPAQHAGDDRIYQVLGTAAGQIVDLFVVDCGDKSVTRLMSGYVRNENHAFDSCDNQYGDRHALIGPKGAIDLTAGQDLAALERIARATGKVTVDGQLRYLRLDTLEQLLPRRLRVNFWCGCELYGLTDKAEG